MTDRDKMIIEQQAMRMDYDKAKAAEMVTQHTLDIFRERVASIEGLEVDGKPVTDFDTFYDVAPPELVSWVMMAVYSTQILTDSEAKN